MIDTITLRFNRSQYQELESYYRDIESLKNHLYYLDKIEVRNETPPFQLELVKPEWGLMVRFKENYFTVSISLWIFYKGNNLASFDQNEIKSALKKLSEVLGIVVEKGYIQRIDIAQNLEMKNEIHEYIAELVAPYKMAYLYDYFGESRAFTNISRNQQICFYNKLKQIKKKGVDPENFPKNILRIEFRLKKQIKNSINWDKANSKLKCIYLYSPTFRKRLITLWFKNVCKLNPISVPKKNWLNSAANYKKYLMAMGIAANGGIEKCQYDIDKIKNINGVPLSAPNKSKLRSSLKRLAGSEKVSEASQLITEMRQKATARFKSF